MKETSMGGSERTFEPTLWTVVLKARDHSAEALEKLMGIYWKPVYFYIRRWGASVEDSKDLTQGFFLKFLERQFLEGVSRERGRFRTFLLTALRHFLINEAEHARALRRGGGQWAVSLDFAGAETDYTRDPTAKDTLDDCFKRQWALTVLQRALEALGRELPPDRFAAIRRHLSPTESPSYDDTARELGVAVTDVKNLLHLGRRRYRELIREEIRASVETDAEVEDEIRDLFASV